MERISARQFLKNGDFRFEGNSCPLFVIFDGKEFSDISTFNFDIAENVFADIHFKNIPQNSKLTFNQNDSSSLQIEGILIEQYENLEIVANLEKRARFEAYFGDFAEKKNDGKITININGEYSEAYWHLASLGDHDDIKHFDVNVNHYKGLTKAKVESYGVAKGQSRIAFAGASDIKKFSRNTNTIQTAKILIFDKEASGIATPTLLIGDNEVAAAHAATVGKVSDDHLFYLQSRGLSEKEAKQLITLGYLNPILNGFKDEDIKEEVNQVIRERL